MNKIITGCSFYYLRALQNQNDFMKSICLSQQTQSFQFMSKQSRHQFKNKDRSSSDESLPEQKDNQFSEWSSLQNRLSLVQTALLKIQKRTQKLQKAIDEQSEELQNFHLDTKKIVEEILSDKKKEIATKQKQLEFENMKAELEDLHGLIKRIEKKNNEMFKQLKNNNLGFSESMYQQKIEQKVQVIFQKYQRQLDKAMNQIRTIIKQFAKDDRRSKENILANSRSRTNIQKSAQKSNRGSYADLAISDDVSIDKQQKCKSPQPNTNTGSRVSYLREKLKQFEQTNKKYEQKLQKKPSYEEKKTMQKMKDFKNYLQQSESELDQSNLETNQHNVLTDSIKNWKKIDRYKYQ